MLKAIYIILSLLHSTFIFSQEKDMLFSLCDDGKTYPYYYPELEYKGGFWEIKQHFVMDYPMEQFQALNNNTGILTVKFNVNCKGETGDFSLQFCDFNYHAIKINQEIIDYLLNKTKTLDNWIPGQDEEGNVVNSHKFFSFRIKEGVLLEILPK